ncbi:MAG: hypothetical protein AAGA90_05340 [Actinomycetota bacterium]
MRRRRLWAAGALVALLATGCSGDPDPESADPSASSTSGSATGSTATDGDDAASTGIDAGSGGDADADDEDATAGDGTDTGEGGTDDAAGDDGAAAPTTSGPATDPSDDASEPEPDGDGFDVDREFSSDSEAENFGPIGSTETTIPTDEGEISIGGGEVPELGDTFPLPDGFEVQLTTEVEGEVGFSGRVDGDFDALVAFFEQRLPEAGYEIVERQVIDGVLSVFTVEGPLLGDVVVSEEPGGGGWTILVALAAA